MYLIIRYEALQLYKSKVRKFMSNLKYDSALQIASNGAITQLKAGYIKAGEELVMLYMSILDTAMIDLTPEVRSTMNSIDSAYPPNAPARLEFLKKFIVYSCSAHTSGRECGDPMLHAKYAAVLWTEHQQIEKSLSHFALGESYSQLLALLMQPMVKDAAAVVVFQSVVDRDRVLTLAVLHFLAVENIRDATGLFKGFQKV